MSLTTTSEQLIENSLIVAYIYMPCNLQNPVQIYNHV